MIWLLTTVALSAPICPTDSEYLSETQYLRALSLDVRGEIPSEADYDRIANGETAVDILDEWLASPAFTDRVIRYHNSLFWNGPGGENLLNNRQVLTESSDGIYFIKNRSERYRGEADLPCSDREATFDSMGHPILEPRGDGTWDDGFVWVDAWFETTQVKVCAMEAQDALIASNGTDCYTVGGASELNCGCGPELSYCGREAWVSEVKDGLMESIDYAVRAMVERDGTYVDLLTEDRMWINGPLTHYFKWQAGLKDDNRILPIAMEQLPALQYDDIDTWVELPTPATGAGVLTSPGYLQRYTTNRARSNRFHEVFLCEPFVPPDNGLPVTESLSNDLAGRQGCDYCHAILEPTAAHWGRYTEYSFGYLDPELYPAYDPVCDWCSTLGEDCSDDCDDFYQANGDPESADWSGWLLAYTFLGPADELNIDAGPELFVNTAVADGRLRTCAARQVSQWLLGRDPTEPGDLQYVTETADAFAADNYRFSTLVRSVLTSDTYRRVP